MAIHSSILAWRISWTKESGALQSIESQNHTRLRQLSTQHTKQCHFNSLPFIPVCSLNTKWIKFCLLRFIHGIIIYYRLKFKVQFSSVTQSRLTLCDPMNRSTPGLPVHHQLPEFTQTHVHRVSDANQPSHPLLSPSPPAPNPSQHQSFPTNQLYA